MAYEELSQCGAIICTHVTLENLPILRAVRDRPLQPEDSDWQFTCGKGRHDAANAKLWALSEILDLDSTLRSILDADVGRAFERDSKAEPWIEVRY